MRRKDGSIGRDILILYAISLSRVYEVVNVGTAGEGSIPGVVALEEQRSSIHSTEGAKDTTHRRSWMKFRQFRPLRFGSQPPRSTNIRTKALESPIFSSKIRLLGRKNSR
jgi:hypothetical protein